MIKKYIPFIWKAKIKLFLETFWVSKKRIFYTSSRDNYIFIFLAADYGNLGDIAITYAQHKFLKKIFPEFIVKEIPISRTLEGIAEIRKRKNYDDIITIIGGGNMGDLYPIIETYRQQVIKNFKKNKIICFPQTVDFSTSPLGRKSLKKAQKSYNNHPHLYLLAREQKSFDYFKVHFENTRSFLVPDIVLTLKNPIEKHSRNGVLISLRSDKEKNLSPKEETDLLKIIKSTRASIKYRDTYIGGERYSLLSRTRELFRIWEDFSKAELVITDRLHGMIFAHITNTPALVFLNNNHKIKSSYDWIRGNTKINLIEEFSEAKILSTIDKIQNVDRVKSIDLTQNYQQFINSVTTSK